MIKKCWRYVYSFRQNPRTWQTDGRTQTPHDGIGRDFIALRGKNWNVYLVIVIAKFIITDYTNNFSSCDTCVVTLPGKERCFRQHTVVVHRADVSVFFSKLVIYFFSLCRKFLLSFLALYCFKDLSFTIIIAVDRLGSEVRVVGCEQQNSWIFSINIWLVWEK